MIAYKCMKKVGDGPGERYEPSECGFRCKSTAVLRYHVSKAHDNSVRIEPKTFFLSTWNGTCTFLIYFPSFFIPCWLNLFITNSARLLITNLRYNFFISEFDVWFDTEINKDSALVRYVIGSSLKNKTKEHFVKKVFKCHRTGFATEKEDRQRKMKSQGSCKMNGYCTSELV